MKKIFCAVLMSVASLYAYGANKMSMVTYFPVPYVAYSCVNVGKQLDVGLHNACELNLGCTESGVSLEAAHTDLLKGDLSLNGVSYITGQNMELGSGVGASDVTFEKNLRIGTLNNGLSLETAGMTLSDLILFPGYASDDSSFPACTGAEGAPEISWQKLKLKDKEEVYLVCGKIKESEGCTPSRLPGSKPCPKGQMGMITEKWNYVTCKYEWEDTCTPIEPEDPCSDRSYKLAHKDSCCPNLPKDDTDCWLGLSWQCEEWGSDSIWETGIPYCGDYESRSCNTEGTVIRCARAEGDGYVTYKECTCAHSNNGW